MGEIQIYKPSEEDADYHNLSAQSYMEVIGNIYENPELLATK